MFKETNKLILLLKICSFHSESAQLELNSLAIQESVVRSRMKIHSLLNLFPHSMLLGLKVPKMQKQVNSSTVLTVKMDNFLISFS